MAVVAGCTIRVEMGGIRVRTVTASFAMLMTVVGVARAETPTPVRGLTSEVAASLASLPEAIVAPPEHDAIPLCGANTPGSAGTENWSRQRDNVVVRNVTRPTLTPVLPARGNATGAVIIAPGGGSQPCP